MESYITIRASNEDMRTFFESNEVCSVRSYEDRGNGTFRVRIRHAERGCHLNGIYTIPDIIAELKDRTKHE